MTWTVREKPKTLKVTRALANEFCDMEPAPHDRRLNERRLVAYEKMFREGTFRPCTWAKAYCDETKGTYRVNGKHTSTLLAGMNPLPDYYVTVESFTCATLEDVARLYATFDSKIQSRTVGDINVSFAGTVPELVGISSQTINLAVTGMAYQVWMIGIKDHPPAERAELLLDYPEFVLWLDGILKSGKANEDEKGRLSLPSRHLRRQAVVAAMFATWRKSKEDATAFWEAVRDETGTSNSLPDRKLARYLLTSGIVGTYATSQRGRMKLANTREMYVKCLHSWNAWRAGMKTDLRYYPEADVPAVR